MRGEAQLLVVILVMACFCASVSGTATGSNDIGSSPMSRPVITPIVARLKGARLLSAGC
jgi:hypothetical protein